MELYFGILFALFVALCMMFVYITSRGGHAYDCILWVVLSLLATLLK